MRGLSLCPSYIVTKKASPFFHDPTAIEQENHLTNYCLSYEFHLVTQVDTSTQKKD